MCTHFHLSARDGSLTVGRSMEYGQKLEPAFYLHRRGEPLFQPRWPDEAFAAMAEAAPLAGDYGYAGIATKNVLPFAPQLAPLTDRILTDGINEAGLSVSLLWFPDARYEPWRGKDATVLAPLFCNWALAHCGSVVELRERLKQVNFWLPETLASLMPFHAAIVDAKGESVVVEFVDGAKVVHANTVGVCTNGPSFPWHRTNLGNYLNLTPNDPQPGMLGSHHAQEPGHGGGLAGLPGNATPPARFVRIAYLKQFSNVPADWDEARQLATHLLNSVDIPRGTVRGEHGYQDYTQYAALKSPTRKLLAFRTDASMHYRALDLSRIDFATVKSGVLGTPPLPDFTVVNA
nr:linear amide C-N hydrolase [Chromobacterium sp. ASV5]